MWLESADRTAMVGWLRLEWVLVATKRVVTCVCGWMTRGNVSPCALWTVTTQACEMHGLD